MIINVVNSVSQRADGYDEKKKEYRACIVEWLSDC